MPKKFPAHRPYLRRPDPSRDLVILYRKSGWLQSTFTRKNWDDIRCGRSDQFLGIYPAKIVDGRLVTFIENRYGTIPAETIERFLNRQVAGMLITRIKGGDPILAGGRLP